MVYLKCTNWHEATTLNLVLYWEVVLKLYLCNSGEKNHRDMKTYQHHFVENYFTLWCEQLLVISLNYCILQKRESPLPTLVIKSLKL